MIIDEPLIGDRQGNEGQGQLSHWASRKPRSGRTIRALFKKEFITKIRHYPSIIEFLGACIIAAFLYPIWKLARAKIDGTIDPPMTNGTDFEQIGMFLYATENPRIVLLPKCPHMTFVETALAMALNATNVSIDYHQVDTVDEMKEIIYGSDSNGVGLYWPNCNSPNALKEPQLQLYKQTLMGDPAGFLMTVVLNYINSVPFPKPPNLTLFSSQVFAQVPHDDLFDTQILVAFFVAAPAILATMPCMQSVLDGKDSHVTTLSLLMGCTEAQHWFVQMTMMIGTTFIPYLLLAIMLCFLFAMVGTSFTLFLFVSFLLCVSHSMFLFFLTTFMKKASTGRAMTVGFALLVIFFGYLHYFYTMNENNTSEVLKHCLSLFPLSAYQLVILMFFTVVKGGYEPVGWADVTKPYIYPIWYGILWLTVDSIVFFLLFLLFNATNSRGFGLPLIRWRDIFKPSAWKFARRSDILALPADGDDTALEVEHLTKVFHGKKSVTAVDDVEFSVKRGEVIVMIGPNGAGKSTIINTISGALAKNSGTMRVFGQPATERFQSIHPYLGVCFQENVLIDLLNAREHFELFGAFRGIEEHELKETMEFFGTTLQLTEVMETRSCDLSGGQKRKLCLALALLGYPPIIIMDEPTAGVDVQARQLIWKTIATLKNSTCLITSHALEEAEAVSSRLFIVSKGKIPFRGTSTELRKEFKCGYILRVEREDGTVGPVLDLVKTYCEDAHVTEERQDSITMQVNPRVPEMLQELEDHKEELGVISYSFAVEQLEDTLLKMIETAEAAYEGHQ